MEIAMNTLIATTNEMLIQILQFAALRCRRDHLWSMLFKYSPESTKGKDNDTEESLRNGTMSILEFKELLSHVHIEKLDIATRGLKELSESSNVVPIPAELTDNLSNIQEWQKRLISVLKKKYWWRHRLLSSDNGQYKV